LGSGAGLVVPLHAVPDIISGRHVLVEHVKRLVRQRFEPGGKGADLGIVFARGKGKLSGAALDRITISIVEARQRCAARGRVGEISHRRRIA
jgi:hypothetical protein